MRELNKKIQESFKVSLFFPKDLSNFINFINFSSTIKEKQDRISLALEEAERKRERTLKAKGLIEKTHEEQLKEKFEIKKLLDSSTSSKRNVEFDDNIKYQNDWIDSNQASSSNFNGTSTPFRLPKLLLNH
jgi:hypothetical protein